MEANPLFSVLAALMAGFVAGIATYEGVLRIAQLEVVPRSELRTLKSAHGARNTPNKDGQSALDSSTEPELPSLPAIHLKTVPDVTPESVEQAVGALRAELGVRPLAPLEEGNSIAATPMGTFGFFYASFFELATNDNIATTFERGTVERHAYRESNFEIAKPAAGEALMIAFVTPSEAARLAILDGKTIHKVTLSPYPWAAASTLVVLPIRRLMTPRVRKIEIEPGKRLSILDASIR